MTTTSQKPLEDFKSCTSPNSDPVIREKKTGTELQLSDVSHPRERFHALICVNYVPLTSEVVVTGYDTNLIRKKLLGLSRGTESVFRSRGDMFV